MHPPLMHATSHPSWTAAEASSGIEEIWTRTLDNWGPSITGEACGRVEWTLRQFWRIKASGGRLIIHEICFIYENSWSTREYVGNHITSASNYTSRSSNEQTFQLPRLYTVQKKYALPLSYAIGQYQNVKLSAVHLDRFDLMHNDL